MDKRSSEDIAGESRKQWLSEQPPWKLFIGTDFTRNASKFFYFNLNAFAPVVQALVAKCRRLINCTAEAITPKLIRNANSFKII
jgi:hypothetical protein